MPGRLKPCNARDLPLTLHIATELHLKRLVVSGFEQVYDWAAFLEMRASARATA